ELLDIFPDPALDLVEQPTRGGIERVIQVENPVLGVGRPHKTIIIVSGAGRPASYGGPNRSARVGATLNRVLRPRFQGGLQWPGPFPILRPIHPPVPNPRRRISTARSGRP